MPSSFLMLQMLMGLKLRLGCRVEIYSLRAVSKNLAGKPEGWNREHLWPRSYGLISGPSLTDLHNIRPADVNVRVPCSKFISRKQILWRMQ